MTTDRLFAVEATDTERRARARTNRAAQGSMFDLEPRPWCCPACGGDRDRCSCATTGAQALALELEPPSSPPVEELTHHEALTIAANHCIRHDDILAIERGGTWKDMHTRTTTPGWCGGDDRGNSDGHGIEVARGSWDAPTVTIRWAELAEVIRAGITPEAIAEAHEAAAEWRELNSKPHNFAKRDEKTIEARDAFYERYSAITDRFRAVERAVIARGLDALAPAATLL